MAEYKDLKDNPTQMQMGKSVMGKTLKELGVKPGDVVACWNGYHKGTEFKVNKDWEKWGAAKDPWWTIASRASEASADLPKLWKDMTPEEKGALLLAHHEGKLIECESHGWKDVACNGPGWYDYCAYRVKPEPVVDTVSRYGSSQDSWWLTGKKCSRDTHRITFDLIDGKPDCNSIKMEEI